MNSKIVKQNELWKKYMVKITIVKLRTFYIAFSFVYRNND